MLSNGGKYKYDLVIVSNADMLKSRVHNLGRMPERRSLFTLGIAYETSTEKLARVSPTIEAAITGVAGPSGGTERNPVGTVCFAWARRPGGGRNHSVGAGIDCTSARTHLDGDRERVRYQAVRIALDGALRSVGGSVES